MNAQLAEVPAADPPAIEPKRTKRRPNFRIIEDQKAVIEEHELTIAAQKVELTRTLDAWSADADRLYKINLGLTARCANYKKYQFWLLALGALLYALGEAAVRAWVASRGIGL